MVKSWSRFCTMAEGRKLLFYEYWIYLQCLCVPVRKGQWLFVRYYNDILIFVV